MLKGAGQIREAYRDDEVAKRYIEERFREPLGALLHARQVRALKRLLGVPGAPRSVLEIAPGPARLTAEIARSFPGHGVALDASAAMIAEARRRVPEAVRARWTFVHGDAFALPFRGGFDVVYTFRFLRHFDAQDRVRLYSQIRDVLRPGGRLVFDAVNAAVSEAVRAADPASHKHYDALHSLPELREEMAAANLPVERVEGVQRGYPLLYRLQVLVAPRSRAIARAAMECLDRLGGDPLEWIVTCRRE